MLLSTSFASRLSPAIFQPSAHSLPLRPMPFFQPVVQMFFKEFSINFPHRLNLPRKYYFESHRSIYMLHHL
jgi:hypothetical protein